MPTLQYVQFDTDPPLVEDLEEQDPDTGEWGPLDVTGKTVRLLAQHRRSGRRFGGAAEQVDVTVGSGPAPTRVSYALQAQDLSEAGDYGYEWEIRTASGATRTIRGAGELRVDSKLGEPLA